MMKKLLPFLCASALALSLTACAGTINNSTADTASNVTFTFTDSGVTAAGETDTGYEIDGTALTITSSGTYTVSGSCADGSIKVKKGTTGVTLVLDGLTLTSENTAAITCGKSSEVTILVSNGTENSLSDTEQNNDDNYPENENAENAVIKCKDGSTVTLSKTAVAQFGKDGATYADFTFVMSKGQSPTLRVNYVTTYALTANVVDDLGLPISGATVTFTPNDAESGTAAQTLVTDSDGKATVYVKRGSYTLTATHERFTSAITQTTSVSSGRTVKMTGEILETVQLVVTNEYGAPLSGAAVSIGGKTAVNGVVGINKTSKEYTVIIGGKTITTGADGTASFSVKRGSYVAQVACTGYKTQAVQLSVTGSLRERVKLG